MEANIPRRVITRIEVAVLLGLGGILMMLVFSAVEASRNNARRTECLNNLKQIGLACQNYHDTQRRFPWNSCGNGNEGNALDGRYFPGYPIDVGPQGGPFAKQWNQFSWIAAADPYFDS